MIPIYVINLKRSVERRRSIEKQLNSLGLQYTIIEGVDAYADRNINRHVVEHNVTLNLATGHVGCVLSHIKVYEAIIKNGNQFAMIVEDDVLISQKLKIILVELQPFLRQDNVYHLSMQCHGPTNFVPVDNVLSNLFICESEPNYESLRGTQAYIVSNKIAAILAKGLYPVRCNIDMWADYHKEGYFKKLLVIFPFPIIHGEFLSDLRNEHLSEQGNMKEVLKFMVYKNKWQPLYNFFMKVRRARVEKRQKQYIRFNNGELKSTFLK